MADRPKKAKVYEFRPGEGRKLKSVKYVSPEKRELLRERKQAKKDRRNFYIGVAIMLLLVAALTCIQLR
jgi:hypothetical protein